MAVYLYHFSRPLGNPADRTGQAEHYTGTAKILDRRAAEELRNGGRVKILEACIRAGITWQLARVWPDGGYKLERRMKDRGGASRFCPVCGVIPAYGWWETDDMNEQLGGWAAAAAAINERFRPQPPVSRSQVAAWHKRGTVNRAGHAPPGPEREVGQPKRTTPRYIFRLADWVDWYRPGVPRRGGNQYRGSWVTWAEQPEPRGVEDVPVAVGL